MSEQTQNSAAASADRRAEVIRLINGHIIEYLDGGPDCEEEDVKTTEAAGLKADGVRFSWANAKRQRAAKLALGAQTTKPVAVETAKPQDEVAPATAKPPKGWAAELAAAPAGERIAVGLRIVADGRAADGQVAEELGEEFRRALRGKAAFSGSAIQPGAESEAAVKPSMAGPSGAVVRLITAKQAKPDAEGRAKRPEDDPKGPPKPEPPGVLNPRAPLDNARKLMRLRSWNVGAGAATLSFWQKQFWEWERTRWQVLDDDTVRSKVYKFLDEAEREVRRGLLTRFEPEPTDVSKTVDALKSEINRVPGFAQPSWFGEAAPVENLKELVACQNGLLYMPDRRLLRHTPRFWSPNVLEYDYDPAARAPRWEQFLREVFLGDSGAQAGLMEMIGLCLTDETKYQKGFMFVGPRRGGRGTIGRVLKGLIGEANYVGANLGGFVKDFGMQNWIGKKVAVFTDENLDGVSKALLGQISTNLKKVTGEDEQSINRKYLGYWEGTLRTRVVIFSNEVLKFQDTSGAVAGRFIGWRMTESFANREDPDLTAKLLRERPGILNMALDALDRLRSRDRFVQHQSGVEMIRSLENMTSDVLTFVEDECEVGPAWECSMATMFVLWGTWSVARGIRYGWGEPQLSEKLRAAVPTITSGRPRSGGPGRPTMLYGIAPRPKGKGKRDAGANA